jgi:hypothetical protein
VVLEMDMRRMEEGYNFNGAGRRAAGLRGELDMDLDLNEVRASRFIECREMGAYADGEVLKMFTICGLPTTMKDTTRAVSSCDLLLDAREV